MPRLFLKAYHQIPASPKHALSTHEIVARPSRFGGNRVVLISTLTVRLSQKCYEYAIAVVYILSDHPTTNLNVGPGIAYNEPRGTKFTSQFVVGCIYCVRV
jgi:hypothetical protein